MTTYTPFVPPQGRAFEFQPTLDGQTYTATVLWNVTGQRWFLMLKTLSGKLVFNQPLISSPDGYDINLAGAYFSASTLVFRGSSQQFEVTP